jgi:hypothetical protein
MILEIPDDSIARYCNANPEVDPRVMVLTWLYGRVSGQQERQTQLADFLLHCLTTKCRTELGLR